MPIALDTFRNIGADATRVKLDEAGGVIATATSPGGRAVAWLSEAFGAGKDENRAAINELVASIRSELGNAVGDAAELALQSRLREGRPLSARTVQQVIGNAESLVQGIREQRAAKLSNLDPGPGGIAHAMVAERMADGRIRPEVGAALLMDTVQRAAARGRDPPRRAGSGGGRRTRRRSHTRRSDRDRPGHRHGGRAHRRAAACRGRRAAAGGGPVRARPAGRAFGGDGRRAADAGGPRPSGRPGARRADAASSSRA